MTDVSPEGGGVMRVRTELVLDQLVSRVLGRALELRAQSFDSESEHALERGPEPKELARVGYASRLAETEMFQPAREPMPWLADLIEARLSDTPSRSEAIAAVSRDLSGEEPDAKPDLGEGSWRVPGPGGHVRHFLVLAAADELMHGEGKGDPELKRELSAGEAKRCFLFGFYVRCCEESAGSASG
jgi:hypothetical protein